jgi:hypothetical protein
MFRIEIFLLPVYRDYMRKRYNAFNMKSELYSDWGKYQHVFVFLRISLALVVKINIELRKYIVLIRSMEAFEFLIQC